ncbi:AraC family transcriptional regulator [Pseudoruegeria sp. SK021]|uniref:AraC family transcriptional regulator n=1 Tax=Pseudoruegeria sp. SK021 TaxID=1933035 RepID=UPI00111C0108|nr:AraC family transcriptional regulator [Pseudoruegeria sp. SK021]
MRATQLSYVSWDHPELPIPLVSALAFLAEVAAREDLPDLGCKVVTPDSVAELGVLGRAAMEGPTVRAGLMRVCKTYPTFSTHERIVLQKTPRGGRLLVSYDIPVQQDALHLSQQYTAALVQLFCLGAGAHDPVFEHLEIPAHPRCGIDHLRPWFGDRMTAARGRVLVMHLSDAVLDLRVQLPAGMSPNTPEDIRQPLSDAGGMEPMIRHLIGTMLSEGVPTARDLALASGLSLRSLQRSLSMAGTSFSAILDAARRDLALERVATGHGSFEELSVELGYADTACLSRAVRRWTGKTPGQLRQAARLDRGD